MSRKKILHVSYSMDTGGGPLTIRRIIEDFPEYNHHVAGNKGVFMDHFLQILAPSKVLFLKGANLPLNLKMLVAHCRHHQIDVLHVHGRGAGSFARFVKIFHLGIKIVYTPNGFYPHSLSFFIRHLYVAGERILMGLTDIVFLVSASELQTFQRFVAKKHSRKCIVVQNYLNPSKGSYEIDQAYPVPRETLNLLYIGRLSLQKGIDILMESLKRVTHPKIRVYIVGYGEYEDYVRRELTNVEIRDKGVFLGKINEAFRLMPSFDGLLLPSRFEGLPFTILEAMWYRLPLVVTPANGIIDILDQQNSHMAESISPTAFAKAIEQFAQDWYSDKVKIEEIAEQNHNLLLTTYSLEAVREKIEYIYQ